MGQTKKPTGLTITRDGSKYIFEWKIASADYDKGQKLEYRTKGTSKWRDWVDVSISSTATKKSITLSASAYYPTVSNKHITAVEFRVKGKRKPYTTGSGSSQRTITPTWSDWASKTMSLSEPPEPVLSLQHNTQTPNKTIFSWSVEAKEKRPFYQVEWQTRLKKDSDEKDGSKISWSSSTTGYHEGTGGLTGSIPESYTTESLATGSYTRWVRVRARGCAGNSDWVYIKYVYATPKQAVLQDYSVKAVSSGNYSCKVKWKTTSNEAHPIDTVSVQYAFGVPTADLGLPASVSWQDVGSYADTKGSDTLSFQTDGRMALDECMFVRINTYHDERVKYGVPECVYTGDLTPLESSDDLAITYNKNNKQARFEATNPSSVPDSFIAISMVVPTDPKGSVVVGIIPSGRNYGTSTLPSIETQRAVMFYAQVIQGEYARQARKDGLYAYEVLPNMTSSKISKKFVLPPDTDEDTETEPDKPVKPSTVTLTAPSTGRIKVAWTWNWASATGAEIAWADSQRAWKSTDAPDSTTVTKSQAGATNPYWNIEGLDTGKKWYVRVRFTGDDNVTSNWSDYASIYLEPPATSDPKAPASISLSKGDTDTSIRVDWVWTWADADSAEISWADSYGAWKSTAEPQYYTVSKSLAGSSSPWWRIGGLEKGKRWYVKVRLIKDGVKSKWSERISMLLPLDEEDEEDPVVPIPPANVVVTPMANRKGRVKVTFDWAWSEADTVEVSWSQTYYAWQSTEGYESYEINNKVSYIMVDNLDLTKWYIRVRLKQGDIVSTWSSRAVIDLTTTPEKPVVSASEGTISSKGNFVLTWDYTNDDGSPQSFASVRIVTMEGETMTLGRKVAHTDTAQGVILYAQQANLQAGNDYLFAVRVKAESGKWSEWSDPVAVSIADELIAVLTSTSLEDITITDDDQTTRTVSALTQMPLTVQVTGAGSGGRTVVAIERAESYEMDRPDEDTFNGYEGETVYLRKRSGEPTFTIGVDNLIGVLDDGAKYRLVGTIYDSLGQSASVEKEFEVHWSHQAIMPEATVVIDGLIAKITPIQPSGAMTGDACDIYRLSTDKPTLVYPNAQFGETYVDPYPAFGDNGGYRIVYKTVYGDYITEDNQPAWIDLTDDLLYHDYTVIDYGRDSIELYYNVDTDDTWEKDFRVTKYLGGSVQGDWNPATIRSGSINGLTLNPLETEKMQQFRRLAEYSGICHVRTKQGSSYSADVQVSETNAHDRYGLITEYSLNITRVDPEGYDGMTLDAWEEENGLE